MSSFTFITLPIGIVRATAAFNADGNFSYAETYPYSVQCTSSGSTTCGNPQFNQAPWQTYSWGVSSYRWCVFSSGLGTVDKYLFSTGPSSAYVLVSDTSEDDGCLIGISVAEFIQGLSSGRAGWPSPAPMPATGENTKISYNLKRHYVNLDPIAGEMGILLDVRADEYYRGVLLHKDLLMDFYVHQECDGFGGFGCVGSNVGDKSCRVAPDAYVCMWRIHTNIADNTWVSDNVDISNYITQSAQYAVCKDQGQPDNCSLGSTTVNLKSFEVITEAHYASEGLTIGYANLYQPYPGTPSAPSGPTSLPQFTGGTYSTSAIDPDGDLLQYQFDWNDGTTTTTGWYTSGATVSATHGWYSPGTYHVVARVNDGHYWSDWSPGLTVYIQNTRCPPHCAPNP